PGAVDRETADELFAAGREPATTVVALVARDRPERDVVSNIDEFDAVAQRNDDAGRFVSTDEGRFDVLDALERTLLPGTQRCRAHLNQDLSRTGQRHRIRAQPQLPRRNQHAS